MNSIFSVVRRSLLIFNSLRCMSAIFFVLGSRSRIPMKIYSCINSESLLPGDVIEYKFNDSTSAAIFLGAVLDKNTLHPLCTREHGSLELVYDESKPPISFKDVKVGSSLDDVLWTQRIVEDRVSNPHGEHAEDVFVLPAEMILKLSNWIIPLETTP